ncbi:WhiB family transcriptional regulator [Nocardia stercoris]|uniref:WhiB family transcriptional regulator n=1 Tax=Nocardia stercoris TaxID=2483361 RepID=UPI001F332BEA|nr:WhiB family transcriptional regulator [Nocardia stercoris]
MVSHRSLKLPAPRAVTWDWQLRAECRSLDVNIFYTERPGQAEDAAKRICASCPVLASCRDYAITAHEPYGIWGGLNPRERANYRWRGSRLGSTRSP